jgi:hypothetical protein
MILLTGAAGGVAGRLHLDGPVRRTDRTPGPGIVPGDLTDPAFARSVTDGVDAVVHLAGQADPETPWDGLRGPNGDAVANVLEAAAGAGVRRVVLASSLHAMAGHADAGLAFIPEDLPPRACCAYGAAKVLAEQLARVYADTRGLSVVCLRLGGVQPRPLALSWRPGWISPADLNRLVAAALAVDVPYGVYHGVSANTPAVYGHTLPGYAPEDDSATYPDLRDDLSEPSGKGIAHRT